MRPLVLALLLAATAACSATPTAPTAPAAPAADPAAAGAAIRMQFSPDATAGGGGGGNVFLVAARPSDAGVAWLGITMCTSEPVYVLRAHLNYDPKFLSYNARWERGEWLSSTGGGMDPVNWDFISAAPGRISLFPTWPTQGSGAVGCGNMIWFQFTPLRRGNSRIELRDLQVFGALGKTITASTSGGLVLLE